MFSHVRDESFKNGLWSCLWGRRQVNNFFNLPEDRVNVLSSRGCFVQMKEVWPLTLCYCSSLRDLPEYWRTFAFLSDSQKRKFHIKTGEIDNSMNSSLTWTHTDNDIYGRKVKYGFHSNVLWKILCNASLPFHACVCSLACPGSSAEIGLKASSIINVIAFRVGSNVP